jgi:uncharacterized protein (DUF1330 family)
MSHAYVVGQITIKNETYWSEYRSKVPATLAPWGAELMFRGKRIDSGELDQSHTHVVVIKFPSLANVEGWLQSEAYNALIPLRHQAAELVSITYEE